MNIQVFIGDDAYMCMHADGKQGHTQVRISMIVWSDIKVTQVI